MNTLLHPTYFPSIASFVAIAKGNEMIFEVADNYQKQTYRNRCHIYGANGKLSLNIPVNHTHKNRQLYKDVKISNDNKWQSQHWKSLQSAYRTSPFFEYYEDELTSLFQSEETYLMEFNFKCFETIIDCLQFDVSISKTKVFEKNPVDVIDARNLVNARKEPKFNFDHYTQVFSNKHGFMSNLSILDLLFNEGANSLNYLKAQNLVL
ncbi:WbqC family protein [Flavobacteriaceae sp. LMIT009]